MLSLKHFMKGKRVVMILKKEQYLCHIRSVRSNGVKMIFKNSSHTRYYKDII